MSYFAQKLSIIATTISVTATTSIVFTHQAQAISVNDVPEIDNYSQIYQLDIPESSAFGQLGTPQYNTDTSSTAVFPNGISRIGYYLELDTDWVWVSMDAFTQDLSKIGVPTQSSGAVWQQAVNNMTVFSNVNGVVTGTSLTGNIEFWPNNYDEAPNNVYDFSDQIGNLNNGGYGSMQIHNSGIGQTLLAYNAWGRNGTSNSDNTIDGVGIGNNTMITATNPQNTPGPHPDWTHTRTADDYTNRNLEVWVQGNASVPFEFSPSLGISLSLGLFGILRVKHKLKHFSQNKA